MSVTIPESPVTLDRNTHMVAPKRVEAGLGSRLNVPCFGTLKEFLKRFAKTDVGTTHGVVSSAKGKTTVTDKLQT